MFGLSVAFALTSLGRAENLDVCGRAGGIAATQHRETDLASLSDSDGAPSCERRGCRWTKTQGCVFGTVHVNTSMVHVVHSNHFDAGYTDGVIK